MGTALQCPDCGFKHRLDAVGADPVFACAKCARPLKVPSAYRTTPTAGATTPRAGDGRRTGSSKPPAPERVGPRMRLPVRILAWVVAFIVSGIVVRTLAKWTGFATSDDILDLLISSDVGNYLRLAVLAPVWALFAAVFATIFIEAPPWWARRKAGLPWQYAKAESADPGTSGRTRSRAPAGSRVVGAPGPAGATAVAGGAAVGASRRVPKVAPRDAGAGDEQRRPRNVARRGEVDRGGPVPARRADDPTAVLAVPPSAAPGEGDDVDEYAEMAAAGQRPRRIPRRDAGA